MHGGAGGGGGRGGAGGGGGAIFMGKSSWEEWQHGTEIIDDANLTRTLLPSCSFQLLIQSTSQYMPIKGKRWNPL